MSEDLFDGRPDSSGAESALKLEAVGAVIQLKVTDISSSFETEYGEAFIITGDVEVKRGDVDGVPEVGDEGSYLVPTVKNNGDDHHIFEELKRALKRVGATELSVGDTFAVRRVEDRPSKKKGYSPFKKHAVVVARGTTELKFQEAEGEAPF